MTAGPAAARIAQADPLGRRIVIAPLMSHDAEQNASRGRWPDRPRYLLIDVGRFAQSPGVMVAQCDLKGFGGSRHRKVFAPKKCRPGVAAGFSHCSCSTPRG